MKLLVRALAAAALALLPLSLVAQDGPGPNTHDRGGRPLTAMDEQGRRYSYTYEPDGTQNRWFGKLVISVKRPDGTLLEFGYNAHNERGQTRITRPGKPTEIVTYPPQPLVPTGQVTYDELGRLRSHTDEEGRRVWFTYDKDGLRSSWREDRLIRVDKIDGTLIEFAYTPRGDRGETRITKPGKPPEVVRYPPQPADESRGKTYDHLGRWAAETVGGKAVRYTYDADGSRNTWVASRLVQVLKLDGTFIEHAYSADGFRGQTRTTRPGQPPVVTDHPRPATAKAVAAGADPTTTKPPRLAAPPKAMEEKPMEPARERAGSAGFAVVPAAASAPLNLSEEPPGSTIRLVTRRTYDDFDRVETETTTLPDGTGERTVSYTYYLNGLRKTLTDPQGNVTFYTYDAQKRLKEVTTHYGTASAKTTTFGYWPDGLLKEVQYPNGVVSSYGYDLADRLLTLTHAKAGGVISSYEYTYDANGNRISQIESNGGVTEVTTYTYDNLNRLKTVTYPADSTFPSGRTVTYEYDAAGNRRRETTRDPGGNLLADKQADFDDVNRLTALNDLVTPANSTTFAWDANGNQTSKTTNGVTVEYRYDTRDKMVETVQGELVLGRFQYDADGRRTKKIGAEGVRQYVYDYTSLLAEYSDTGLEVAKYDYGADRLISLTRGTQKRYYLFDALRSVTNITTETGLTAASYHLDAWGNFRIPSELASSDDAASKNRFAFTGYLWDQETALYYAKARYYDPEVGRFTSQDSFLGEINDPPSLHRYFYGNANPTRYIDPTGHASIQSGSVGQTLGALGLNEDENAAARQAAERLGTTVAADAPALGGALEMHAALVRKYGEKGAQERLAALKEGNFQKIGLITIEEDDFNVNGSVNQEKIFRDFLSSTGRYAGELGGLRELLAHQLAGVSAPGDVVDISETFDLGLRYSQAKTAAVNRASSTDTFFIGGIQRAAASIGQAGMAPPGTEVLASIQLALDAQLMRAGVQLAASGGRALVNRLASGATTASSRALPRVAGGSQGADRVYRVIRADELPSEGLVPTNPLATYKAEGHVLHGSRPGFKSQFISTTTDPAVARQWAAQSGGRIVEIDLSQVDSRIINLSTDAGRAAHLKGVTARAWAKKSSEVLIEGRIPPEAIRVIE